MKSKTAKPREAMGYIRVSKVAGRDKDESASRFHSPEMQLDTVKASAEAAGGVFVGYRYDPDKSGYSGIYRPGWEECVDWVMESPRERMIVAYDTSRLSRNLWKLLGDVQHKIVPAGGRVIVAGDGIDTDEENWQDRLHFAGMFAERTSRDIGTKWTKVLNKRATVGKSPTGKVPYGYAAVIGKDGKPTGALVEDPETAPVMRRMYALYLSGEGLRAIAETLNSEGVPSPGGSTWAVSTIKRLLENGAAAGLLRFRGELTKGGWDSLISQTQWRAFEVERKRRRKIPNRSQAPKWTLAGIAVCAYCGSRLTVTSLVDPKGMAACSTYRTRGKAECRNVRGVPVLAAPPVAPDWQIEYGSDDAEAGGVFVNRLTLENQFTYFLAGHLDVLADRIKRGANKTAASEQMEADTRSAVAREALEKISTARTRLATAWAMSDLGDAEYRAGLADLEAQAESHREVLEAAEAVAVTHVSDEDTLDALINGGETVSHAEWAQILRRVITRVEVSRDTIKFVPKDGDPSEVARAKLKRKPGRPRKSDVGAA
ncbi:recombinase family protein [Nocardioides sp. InS609-2]|uniref:recombinase family protein n=1 Tax=Nocardioides sp. InS609-2 TaxID=2760705 RepID=UPI0020BDC68C|nr:recombinase family protein [Nocardioides sp. InS609-2]